MACSLGILFSSLLLLLQPTGTAMKKMAANLLVGRRIQQKNSWAYSLGLRPARSWRTTAVGETLGLSGEELLDSRKATAADPKVDAALRFARELVEIAAKSNSQKKNVVRVVLAFANAASTLSSKISARISFAVLLAIR